MPNKWAAGCGCCEETLYSCTGPCAFGGHPYSATEYVLIEQWRTRQFHGPCGLCGDPPAGVFALKSVPPVGTAPNDFCRWEYSTTFSWNGSCDGVTVSGQYLMKIAVTIRQAYQFTSLGGRADGVITLEPDTANGGAGDTISYTMFRENVFGGPAGDMCAGGHKNWLIGAPDSSPAGFSCGPAVRLNPPAWNDIAVVWAYDGSPSTDWV